MITEADAIRQRAIEIINRRHAASQRSEVQPKTGGDAKPAPEAETGPLKVGGDEKAPVIVQRVEAVYPEEARQNGVSGIAILELVIDKTGRVVRASVLKPVEHGGSEAALAAVKQWTFRPATRNGEPVDAIFNVTVRIGPASAH